MRRHFPIARLAAAACLVLAPSARATLADKIEVDEGDVAKPGELGVKVHVNATPSGVGALSFDGEVPTEHGWRLAAEITYGIGHDLEIGTTLPFVHSPVIGNRSAGVRTAVKWNPVHPEADADGASASVQLEYGWISGRFQREARVLDVTPVLAWRDADWRLALNPVLTFPLAGPGNGSSPRFNPAWKAARRVGDGWWIGPEYYGALGPLAHIAPAAAQSHTLYLALDLDREPWAFNFGVGRGLNAATDRWTVKAIVDLPF